MIAEKDCLLHPVPVVRLIITNKRGHILMLRRHSGEYSSGQWCLPGGKIDYGETVERTIAKELLEETSLSCIFSKFLFYQDSLPQIPGKMHCIHLYFECTVAGTIVLNEESSEFAWIGQSDLKNYDIAFRNDLALLRYWEPEG
jgi:8-oxo-dGTP diphosphatase